MLEDDNSDNFKILAGIAAAMCVALVVIFFTKANKPAAVPVPTAFKSFTARDGSFACKLPERWRRERTDAFGITSGVSVEKASAGIEISADLQGSLMGDMAQAANNMSSGASFGGTSAPPKPPVESVHEAALDEVEFENVRDDKTVVLPSRLGDARLSDWTGQSDGPFGSINELHGYRVTILGSEKRYSIVCYCRESDWPRLRPVFQKVIASVGPAPTKVGG